MLELDQRVLAAYGLYLAIRQLSPETVRTRFVVLGMLTRFLAGVIPLAQVEPADLVAWQGFLRHRHPNTARSYASHVRQFYGWAYAENWVASDPSRKMIEVKGTKGKPRPMHERDIAELFATAAGARRLPFSLAAFAGLRCAEISRLQRQDVDLYAARPVLFVHGKGRRERTVPLLDALAAEIAPIWRASRRGWLVVRADGTPYSPNRLSRVCNDYLHLELGITSTLHSLRHWYATNVVAITHDPLFVRDLLGHSSVTTTELYMDTAGGNAHERLDPLSKQAAKMLGTRHLHAVREDPAKA